MDQTTTFQRGLRPGDAAPAFRARTTHGERALEGYRGRWLIFFSHPADFTPVCTTEFISLARAADRFAKLDCELLGLSVDSLFSHLAWLLSIEETSGTTVPFPIVEDPSMAIAQAYGMTAPGDTDSASVRATYFIDPKGIIRALTWYPMTNGRSVEEMLRLLAALQATDKEGGLTPEGWRPGEALISPAPVTLEAARQLAQSARSGGGR
ncbi:peroxiredoxin [Caulobacter segnis]|uniref:peroxiredoxin n=1 Tax=Caulobacter segnis TaxID=88688 RepID=UPI00240F71BB|nr:peroxiredoxin [Caulobacter segnis]MDG2522930.1 peroxiredoxin [Caulobacter segnis]